MNLLELKGLSVSFGALKAVSDVDLVVPEGGFVGLIGPNGAGKTTLIDAVSGIVPSTGRVDLAGRRLDRLSAFRRARAGLARTFQSIELFDDLTIRENLLTTAESSTVVSLLEALVRRRAHPAAASVADSALELLDIGHLADRLPGEVSLGQRKLVTVARALSGSPTMLLLDEPAAGLDTEESLALGEKLKTVAGTGTSILLVDHDMGLVLSVCDYIYVIEFGRIIAEGTPADIIRDPKVISAYLGEDTADAPQEEVVGP